MELTNEFTVDVPLEEAWSVLTDVERIAPCMPGAKLESVEDDQYRGVVKVKVGPVTAEYKGTATFLEKDEVAHRAVLRAEGRETRGQGNASATISATLQPSGDATRVTVTTDLAISGRVAQFGRGVLADVSAKLLNQFVESLESTVLAGGGADDGSGNSSADATGSGSGGSATTSDPGAATTSSDGGRRVLETAAGEREVVPVNLVRVVGPVVVKRMLAPLAAVVVFAAFWRRRKRKNARA